MPRIRRGASATEGKISVATQTENVNDNPEIAHLQEQLKQLQLQNETLLKQIKVDASITVNSPSKNLRSMRSLQMYNETIESVSRSPMKGCTCKRNCSSKQCGCVKKSLKCGLNCKCSSECQNQDFNDEVINKENVKAKDLNSQSMDKLNSNDKNKNTAEFTPPKVKQINYDSGGENQQNNELMNKSIDPTKPKHQLLRTPPRTSTESASQNSSPESMDASAEPVSKKTEEIPEALKRENVDLNELNIELINCSKCKRRFYPWRIEAHEAVCRKV